MLYIMDWLDIFTALFLVKQAFKRIAERSCTEVSLGQIIRKKREKCRLTLDEVSVRTGFSKPYLSTVETGRVKNPPSDELLSKLERVLGFEKGQLLNIAHLESLPTDVRHDYEAMEAQIRKYRKLIRRIIDFKSGGSEILELVASEDIENESSSAVKAGTLVPIINRVSAGYPVDFDDMGYPAGFADDYVRCPDLHDPNMFAVRVVGDSMEPRFYRGDIVVFSPAAEIKSGDDCFVRFIEPHETTFKRVFFESDQKVRLVPRNDKYPPLIYEGKRINGMYRAVIKYEKL